ncbi:AAA domain-containing protein [Campylobacter insulaenigrae]|uniref:AAA domain-containing protein n=1 Tax=Campylobacter insulaenigrae TaxID=260714 RepID=UPI00215305FE|nr:AAA domain-containing protein [Campylobacter insulaenigrae]MCR6587683.1 AAA domain-containing protein [Campylobacter insulaenigrae]
MDIEKYLIIIKDKDETSKICSFEKCEQTVSIKFNTSEKIYNYNINTCKIYDNPKKINANQINGIIFCNIKFILQFDCYYKIFYNDDSVDLILSPSSQSSHTDNNIFNYYQSIAREMIIQDNEKSIIERSYKKIKNINKHSALHAYLTQNASSLPYNRDFLLFPFGTNQSQYQAVKNALNSQVSIIEGPPGTGKTQTILNIIANLIAQGKNVAVVSNNNEATQNVFEKLKNYNLDFLCATLGKADNKQNFINNQPQLPQNFDTFKDNTISSNIINQLNQDIQEIFILQNKLAKDKELLEEFKTQKKYTNFFNAIQNKKFLNLSSKKILKVKVYLEELQYISFFHKIKIIILDGIANFSFFKNTKEVILQTLESYFYINSINELKNNIQAHKNKLVQLDYENKIKNLQNSSTKFLKNYLISKYQNKRKIFTLEDLNTNVDEFLRQYPIIFSTTHSIINSLNMKDNLFDYIIVDESSQVDVVTGALALSIAKNAVIVGDKKQLSYIVDSKILEKVKNFNKQFNVKEEYNYLTHSFLDSVCKIFHNSPKILLREHYRCHPKIIGFCNKKFYNNELLIFSEDNNQNDAIKVILTQAGNHAKNNCNFREIEIIKEEIIPELNTKIELKNLGIISPYNNQKDELKLHLDKNIQVDTIHKFQGREKDGIIISLVDNKPRNFIDDPKMLNVSITRAKNFLYLVTNSEIIDTKSNISDFIRYAQYNNFEVVKSKINSIFDLLYDANKSAREEYLKGKKKISLYDSENLAYHTILEVLQDYPSFKVANHVRLGTLIKDTSLLDTTEKIYIDNALTHIDFLIYHEMDKHLILAIEIDGYNFHNIHNKQYERDKIKNSILKKYNVSLLRLSTIGNSEKKQIKDKIDELI